MTTSPVQLKMTVPVLPVANVEKAAEFYRELYADSNRVTFVQMKS